MTNSTEATQSNHHLPVEEWGAVSLPPNTHHLPSGEGQFPLLFLDPQITMQPLSHDNSGPTSGAVEDLESSTRDSDGHQRNLIHNPLQPSHLELLAGSPAFDLGDISGFFKMPSSQPSSAASHAQASIIPAERFEQIERLWPGRRRSNLHQSSPFSWVEVANHPMPNLFMQHTPTDPFGSPEDQEALDSTWNFTEACRTRLMQDCSRYFNPGTSTFSISPEDPGPSSAHASSVEGSHSSPFLWNGQFPSADVLDLSLDQYFYHFHVLFPIVHPPTFDASMTPSELLFPMCLIGLELLDNKATRGFVESCLPGAMYHCRAVITSSHLRRCPSAQLLIMLGSATHLLFIATVIPEMAYQEQVYSLHQETLSLAQQRGLFTAPDLETSFWNAHGNDDIVWYSWARVESAKRLLLSLIFAEAYSGQVLKAPPTLKLQNMRVPVLCSDRLFALSNAKSWKAATGPHPNQWCPHAWTLALDPAMLPDVASDFGIQGLLASVWLYILESNYSPLTSTNPPVLNLHKFYPSNDALTSDTRIKDIISIFLAQIYDKYRDQFRTGNTNSLFLWHFLCLNSLVDINTCELAAGRNGPDHVQKALDSLEEWAQTPQARRACLHSAQFIAIVARHKASDGVMLHTEIAMFAAALVLGFYLLNAPSLTSEDHSTPLNLLDEIDWTLVGAEMNAGSSSSADCPVVQFIRTGGPVAFATAVYRNRHGAARRAFMNFAALLEKIGRWNYRDHCRILRIISNTLFEPGGCGL
ncbi:hypothetical protein AWENTII_011382 [Aspergillus wentii]|nr:hypothetical protein MW887_003848 [Aspergillus wentii]